MTDARITDLAPWLRPTLLGPFLTMSALVTWSHLAIDGAADEVFLAGQHFDSWLVTILITSFVAAAISVNLLIADVALLRAKMRRIPTGIGAWLGSMLAPFALFLGWHVIAAPSESVLEAVLRFGLPFPITALATRFVIGRKP